MAHNSLNRTGPEILDNNKCIFSVWAPEKKEMTLHIVYPSVREVIMEKNYLGYFSVIADNVTGGCRYFYKPDKGKDIPDPSSHYQPEGVHGPSEVIDHKKYLWNDKSWKGIPFKELILYEIHVGTFTSEGTIEAIIPYLSELSETGINALELMPLSQFPGSRNWGYDGVYPYAVQNSYGGPEALKKLVDASHQAGIAVFLDVVYNHLGPEGNYFNSFGPYFTNKYHVPWGDAINFDDAWSDGVREYFSDNPIHWFRRYHIDGLRADAIHTIFDSSAEHFWELTQKKLKQEEQEVGQHFYMIAESDFNSPRVVKAPEAGGYGFDAQWLDDFHHALYVILHKGGKSRYEDFGKIEQLSKAYKDGFVHSGEMVSFRKRRHGAPSVGIPGEKFIAFNQNHDQIGNRVSGERLSVLIDFERLKLASAALFLSPYIPLLFMGEEYGEDNPFYYFVSHSNEELINAVREGRKKEFAGFNWNTQPPDPQNISTFNQSKLNRQKRAEGRYRVLLKWNSELISLRKTNPSLQNFAKDGLNVYVNMEMGILLHRRSEDDQKHILCFFNFSDDELTFHIPSHFSSWVKILDSKDDKWNPVKDNENYSSPLRINANSSTKIRPCSVVLYGNEELKNR